MVHSDKRKELASTVRFHGVLRLAPRLGSYSDVANQLFERYANAEVIVKADSFVPLFTQRAFTTLFYY